ncbi:MAG: phenylalanine--tRNA ligase subunit alpha [Syntrophomonadaceae bacterium]|nr:phenylalanine--tRNA ligase subunit alpha [Syntrophomonadaceae bacterium]
MHNKLEQIAKEAEEKIKAASNLEALKNCRVEYLGRKGEITAVLRSLKDLPPEERAAVGQAANRVRDHLEELIESKTQELNARALQERLMQEKLDVTLPGTPRVYGGKHPLTLVREEIENIFLGLGFEIVEGPEVELDYYNFEALNMPADHPARDMQDSFYMSDQVLLRTHTSPGQVRTMEQKNPALPIKIIIPGRVYRRDDDATHSPMFHQVEGLYIGERVTFADLKGILMLFAQKVFGQDVRVRFRPSYFPFTEPSAEMDISCVICGGIGCRTCSNTGWLEILGSGMVHPNVLRAGGYDPEKVTGFAFGMGIERIAMLKFGIDDLRLFFDNDIRFLAQF